jgi:dTDP-L-rhamnose 4-epimerase
MGVKSLVTGGAGFIGSYLVDALLKKGHEVIVYDNLEEQVHGAASKPPAYLNGEARFINGDVRNKGQFKKALKGVDYVFHQAACVGVGQSMYDLEKYMSANTMGTTIMWDILINDRHKVKKIIVASSMSIYGEGAYRCKDCGTVYPAIRSDSQLKLRKWDMKCPQCNHNTEAHPTDESKPLCPTSVYAISKRDQEEMSLTLGRAYKIPAVALRYFNTYGPRQALSNPYTGAAAIFSSRILNNKPPVIFEDGYQSRDFIHVQDIVQANLLAMNKRGADYEAFNVGTGRKLTILDLANILIKRLNFKGKPQIINKFRAGDIRHCYADITKIKKLGFEPKVRFEDGIDDLITWVRSQISEDLFEKAKKELEEKRLTL